MNCHLSRNGNEWKIIHGRTLTKKTGYEMGLPFSYLDTFFLTCDFSFFVPYPFLFDDLLFLFPFVIT